MDISFIGYIVDCFLFVTIYYLQWMRLEQSWLHLSLTRYQKETYVGLKVKFFKRNSFTYLALVVNVYPHSLLMGNCFECRRMTIILNPRWFTLKDVRFLEIVITKGLTTFNLQYLIVLFIHLFVYSFIHTLIYS